MRTYKPVGTKVKPEIKERFGRLCRARGTTEYNALQLMVELLVLHMDDMHDITPEMSQVISVFEDKPAWEKTFNIADPNLGKEVAEAVYFTRDPKGEVPGTRASLVRRTPHRHWEHTDNVVGIFERVVELLLPDLYRKLRLIAVDAGCKNLVWLLRKMVERQHLDNLEEELRTSFGDARAENGKPVEYGRRTKRKKRVTPDDMEDDMGFKPIGGEW